MSLTRDHAYIRLSLRLTIESLSLNMTVANFVYIMEPQWNPMVESQAIGRVYRLGQTRPITVIRYLIKDTVEEVR